MLTASARGKTRKYSLTIVAILVVLGLFHLDATLEFLLGTAMAWAIAAIGLDLFSGYLGQPSFGHAGFVGMGAYSFAILRSQAHLPFVVSACCAVVAVGVVAALVGLAMVRLRDFGLVLGTFFFSYVVTSLLSGTTFAGITHSESGLQVAKISMGSLNLSSGKSYYYLCATILLGVVWVSSNYADSRAGRALRLVKRSDVVAEALGVRSRWVRLTAFTYSAALAGIAGVLLAIGAGYIAPENFTAQQSIILFAMVAVGGLGSIAGPILGALLFTLTPNYLQSAKTLQELLFAAMLLLTLVLFRDGLFGILVVIWRTVGGHLPVARVGIDARGVPTDRKYPEAFAPASRIASTDSQHVLDVVGVGVEYDGLRALEGVSFSVVAGGVHALIGPNGAGKTTLLNCISGLEPVSAGHLNVREQPVTSNTPLCARRLGVCRTFQNPSLVPDLSCLENVMLGLYFDYRASLVRDLLGLNRGREREVARLAAQTLRFVGVAQGRADVAAKDLTLADSKLIDIARAVAMRGCLLVMDEPTAGLSGPEMIVISDVIRKLRDQTAITVLVVSHHVAWVKEVAQSVTVLAAGRVIAEGTPTSVIADARVREVFLGESDDVAAEASAATSKVR